MKPRARAPFASPAPPRRTPTRDRPRRADAVESPGAVLKAILEYDGGRYRGWQAQINARTVQGVLAEAVAKRLGPGVRIHGAGRTDAGVHALGQVASLHLPAGRDTGPSLEALRRDLNDALPFDVNVLELKSASPAFHARHDADLRVYRYRIARRRTAFGKPWVFWVKDHLDLSAMAAAAGAFVGRHDFATFCENPEGHDSTIVEVSFSKVKEAAGEPGLVLFRIGASHFLWKMVRRLVGTLIEIGAGRESVDLVPALLVSRSPKVARWTAPASGLFLESVAYPDEPAPEPPDPLRPAF